MPSGILLAGMTRYEQSPGSLSRQLKRARGADHAVYVLQSGMPPLMGGQVARSLERRCSPCCSASVVSVRWIPRWTASVR